MQTWGGDVRRVAVGALIQHDVDAASLGNGDDRISVAQIYANDRHSSFDALGVKAKQRTNKVADWRARSCRAFVQTTEKREYTSFLPFAPLASQPAEFLWPTSEMATARGRGRARNFLRVRPKKKKKSRCGWYVYCGPPACGKSTVAPPTASSSSSSSSTTVWVSAHKRPGLALQLKEEAARVFNAVLDVPQEGHRFLAVDQTVVVCQRQVHDGPAHAQEHVVVAAAAGGQRLGSSLQEGYGREDSLT